VLREARHSTARDGKRPMTQEEAADRIGIGLRTLIRYEEGSVLVPPDVILRASEVYGQPALCNRYCRELCPIGQATKADVLQTDLPTSVLRLQHHQTQMLKTMESLVAIAADGQVTSDELPLLEEILGVHLALGQAIEALVLAAASSGADVTAVIRRQQRAGRVA
jgi:transcriptional regulator with XRE-family HTH domain